MAGRGAWALKRGVKYRVGGHEPIGLGVKIVALHMALKHGRVTYRSRAGHVLVTCRSRAGHVRGPVLKSWRYIKGLAGLPRSIGCVSVTGRPRSAYTTHVRTKIMALHS
jgi:hypothetical protein